MVLQLFKATWQVLPNKEQVETEYTISMPHLQNLSSIHHGSGLLFFFLPCLQTIYRGLLRLIRFETKDPCNLLKDSLQNIKADFHMSKTHIMNILSLLDYCAATVKTSLANTLSLLFSSYWNRNYFLTKVKWTYFRKTLWPFNFMFFSTTHQGFFFFLLFIAYKSINVRFINM